MNNVVAKQDCKICYQIKCKKCGWVAIDKEVDKIQKGEMTACPVCGWKPGDIVEILDVRL